MQCAFSLSYPACMSLSDLESYDSTDMFECLLAHSSLQQSAAELVSTAWSLAGAEHWHGHAMQPRPDDHNMPNWLDYTDEEVSRARPMHRNINMCTRAEARFKTKAQHNMLCSLLQAAAAKDGAATETAIFQCINKVYSVYRVAFGRYNCDLRCGCGWCTPDLPEPQDILRAQTLLEALSAVWLTSEPADIAAQRAAVQHMLVSAAASLRQAQQLQEQQRAEASSIADRLAEVALREQRVAEREQQVKAREEALGQVPLRAAAPVKKRRQ
jgi:hypothetical protein